MCKCLTHADGSMHLCEVCAGEMDELRRMILGLYLNQGRERAGEMLLRWGMIRPEECVRK